MLYMILGSAFVIFGLAFATGKLLSSVRGWTAMSSEEQQAIRILPLCRNIGFVICLAGALFLAGGFLPAFRETYMRLGLMGWFALCIGDLIYIGKSRRYLM